jgi:hypothetical protein
LRGGPVMLSIGGLRPFLRRNGRREKGDAAGKQ